VTAEGTRVEIGKMCEKGSGHLSLVGETDHGACGSHYYATVYIEIDRDSSREEVGEFEARATLAGQDLAMRLNRLEHLEMQAWYAENESTS